MAVPGTGEAHAGIVAFEIGQQRPIAHHGLRAGQIEVEEGADVLLHRNPTNIEKQRARQVGEFRVMLVAQFGAELRQIHPARPGADAAEATPGEFLTQRRCRHHHALPRIVEATQPQIAPARRHPDAGMQIFGKAGVERRGERTAAFDRPGAGGQAKWAFSGDVQRIRPELLDQP